MISAKRGRIALLALATTLISACGGGGGSSGAPVALGANGSASPSASQPSQQQAPSLSANQQAFENLILAPSAGSYQLIWNLNYSGGQTSGTNFAESGSAVMAASPLTNGPQTTQQTAAQNLASTLALVSPGETRVLKNGAILVSPFISASTVSYVGGDVQINRLAGDNRTVIFSGIRSNYETVALTGAMTATSPDFAHFHNSFFSNPAVLKPTATWAAGASYIKFTETALGDRYYAHDCAATTTDANISACATNATLADVLTPGITSPSDAVTYLMSDGTVRMIDGVKVWVANAPRPRSATLSMTVQYRVYFELNGNVYTGALVKDGTPLGGSYYVSNPGGATVTDRLTFLPFHVRMNKAARDSLAAAMAI